MKYGRKTDMEGLKHLLKEPRPERLSAEICNELLELKPGECLVYDGTSSFGMKWAIMMFLHNNSDRFQFAETKKEIYVYRDK